MSDDPGNQFFSDGISEELLNALVHVEGLRSLRAPLLSLTATAARHHGHRGPLRVGHILEGSVRKSGHQVRITAQLIDALDDRHIFSETYDRI